MKFIPSCRHINAHWCPYDEGHAPLLCLLCQVADCSLFVNGTESSERHVDVHFAWFALCLWVLPVLPLSCVINSIWCMHGKWWHELVIPTVQMKLLDNQSPSLYNAMHVIWILNYHQCDFMHLKIPVLFIQPYPMSVIGISSMICKNERIFSSLDLYYATHWFTHMQRHPHGVMVLCNHPFALLYVLFRVLCSMVWGAIVKSEPRSQESKSSPLFHVFPLQSYIIICW